MSSVTRMAVLGGGVMGETLIGVLAAADAGQIVVAEKSAERAAELTDRHRVTVAPAAEAVVGADIVLVVVKPQDVPALLADVAAAVEPTALVVSLAAGITCAIFEGALKPGTAVVRVMPNTPALVGQGAFGVSAGSHVSDDQLATVVDLLSGGGEVVVVPESQQDAVTAVSGSGPAYVFYLAEQMIAAGVDEGLAADVARALTVQTIVGAGALLASSADSPEELRRRVTSPNGTTFAATEAFDAAGVGKGLHAGVLAAAARSAELSAPAEDR